MSCQSQKVVLPNFFGHSHIVKGDCAGSHKSRVGAGFPRPLDYIRYLIIWREFPKKEQKKHVLLDNNFKLYKI